MKTIIPVEGSIRWCMDHGILFHVEGRYEYGSLVSHVEVVTPEQAAKSVMVKTANYSAWAAPGTVLTVWNVYGGGIGGFLMQNAEKFIFENGKINKFV